MAEFAEERLGARRPPPLRAHLLEDDTTKEEEGRLLEAFVLGALNELDEMDGAARVDTRLHEHGFVGEEGDLVPDPMPAGVDPRCRTLKSRFPPRASTARLTG